VAAGYVWDHMRHTFPVVLGRDFAGTVEAAGPDADTPRPGDRVAGVIQAPELGPGAIGERVTVEAATVTVVPGSVTSVQAVAVGFAGVTAVDLVAALEVGADDVVLVSGATGGVGGFTVQLASSRGARVIATARPGAATEFVRGLGAADVVDYSGDVTAAVHSLASDGVTKVAHAAGDRVLPAEAGRAPRHGRCRTPVGSCFDNPSTAEGHGCSQRLRQAEARQDRGDGAVTRTAVALQGFDHRL